MNGNTNTKNLNEFRRSLGSKGSCEPTGTSDQQNSAPYTENSNHVKWLDDGAHQHAKGLVIDVPNLRAAAAALGGRPDYPRIIAEVIGDAPFIGTAVVVVRHMTEAMDRFLRFLGHRGLSVAIWKPVTTSGAEKTADDVLIAVEALKLAYRPDVDELVLVSGDSDLRPVARECRRLGKRMTVAAYQRTIAASLYVEADAFIALSAAHVLHDAR